MILETKFGDNLLNKQPFKNDAMLVLELERETWFYGSFSYLFLNEILGKK